MTEINENGILKCQVEGCKNAVRFNYQKVWVRYGVDSEGDYTRRRVDMPDIEEPIEDCNLHYCKKHAEQFENGELEE